MDFLCFSHLRWNFVYQRPQHLLSRFARKNRVFYVEEPDYHQDQDRYVLLNTPDDVIVVKLQLSGNADQFDVLERQKNLIADLIRFERIAKFVLWYYTPMALQISRQLEPEIIVFDCMDELSAFKFAPPLLLELEEELLAVADVVFTGGASIYNAKKSRHANIHSFPSSIDKDHFVKARANAVEPSDQLHIKHPRLGYYGVIDERFDIDLIAQVAERKPDWHFVLIGPVVKIEPETLPRRPNIHYLGGKSYDELPDYLGGWDIALIPFLLNESTRFISPTKTPEYLAGGKAVISTGIQDVVHSYGEQKLVRIVGNAGEFITAAEEELDTADRSVWLARVDKFLEDISWDKTWRSMADQINAILPNASF